MISSMSTEPWVSRMPGVCGWGGWASGRCHVPQQPPDPGHGAAPPPVPVRGSRATPGRAGQGGLSGRDTLRGREVTCHHGW